MLFISAPVIRNIVSGSTGYLHYKMDEEKLLSRLDLKAGCHYALENRLRKEVGYCSFCLNLGLERGIGPVQAGHPGRQLSVWECVSNSA